MPCAAPQQPKGRWIGSYKVHGVLGAGGMAKVYLAERPSAIGKNRFCALKVPHSELSNAQFRSMFETEAKLAAEIQHPHVCYGLEAGDIDGTPYLAMELLRGRSMAAVRKAVHVCEEPRRHAGRIARVIADACEGLQAIHEHGSGDVTPPRVVHRDISPDNLFLTIDGFVKILDFGLAKAEPRREATEPGLLKGKISYIAPELLNGDAPTPAADIWGLGVVTWELLTCRRLFDESTDLQTLTAVREQVLEAPSAFTPGIPRSIDAVVMRALSRDPAKRYASAAEFGRALWDFMVREDCVIHHAELAAWLHALFPADREALAAIADLEWDEDTLDDEIIAPPSSEPSTEPPSAPPPLSEPPSTQPSSPPRSKTPSDRLDVLASASILEPDFSLMLRAKSRWLAVAGPWLLAAMATFFAVRAHLSSTASARGSQHASVIGSQR